MFLDISLNKLNVVLMCKLTFEYDWVGIEVQKEDNVLVTKEKISEKDQRLRQDAYRTGESQQDQTAHGLSSSFSLLCCCCYLGLRGRLCRFFGS